MASRETPTPDRIDPTTIEVPDELASHFQRVFGLAVRPDTYGEWASAIVDGFAVHHDRALSTDDLCDTEKSPHSATVGGETTHYVCVQDPIVVGLLAEEPVTVESTPPTADEPVTIEFAPDGTVTAEPAGSLLSFGIDPEADAPERVTPEAMYGLVCPYGHAFPDDESYETWARETDAVTDVLSVPAGIAVMGALIDAAGFDRGTGLDWGGPTGVRRPR
jgi:hypothetical protein